VPSLQIPDGALRIATRLHELETEAAGTSEIAGLATIGPLAGPKRSIDASGQNAEHSLAEKLHVECSRP
jgi:hypothetical protein